MTPARYLAEVIVPPLRPPARTLSFLYGTEEELATQLHEFRRAGVDETVLNLAGVTDKFASAPP